MIYDYNSDRLSAMIKDFFNATGVTICFLDNEFSALNSLHCPNSEFCSAILKMKDGEKLCKYSDAYILENCRKTKSVQVKRCHAGLVDVVVPLVYNNDILGYIIMGQMKTSEDFDSIKKYLKNCDENLEELMEHYRNLPLYDEEKVKSVISIATMLAEYIILKDFLRPNFNKTMETALEYISDHLLEEISIKEVAKYANVSPSCIYNYFQKYFGTTPKGYINRLRIKNAKTLLKTTDMSIEVVSQMTGFSTAAYFTRVFKQINGISPLKYRNSFKINKKKG